MAPSLDVMMPSDPMRDYYSQGLRKRFQLDGMRIPSNTTKTRDPKYSDIKYTPSKANYIARATARFNAGRLESTVPDGWPTALSGPMLWTNEDFPDEKEFVHQLTDVEKEEINAALKYFNKQELEGHEVNRDNFPLPTLGRVLDNMCADLYHGKGVAILRGLNPSAFSAEDLTVIYLGVSSYIAERRGRQDQRGSMIMHVITKEENDGYGSQKPFHTDTVCDVLALLTRGLSAKGGKSILSSSYKVYNELAATRPDLIHVLAKDDWPFDTYGRDPPYYERACLYYHNEKMILNFSRRLLTGHPTDGRTKGIPGLNEAQAEALDAVHFIASKYQVSTSMELGDMRFINNNTVLHCREAFVDDLDTKRHLVRLWLNNEKEGGDLPPGLKLAWARVFEDVDRNTHWDIDPPSKEGKILRVAYSCD